MKAILIADSGATKTSWALLYESGEAKTTQTLGINPLLQSQDSIKQLLEKDLAFKPQNAAITKVVYYGAGASGEKERELLKATFRNHFSLTEVEVHSDLLAAARATAGREKGIVCILGTGSNSCYYDGNTNAFQHPSLGYLAGDEGSGNALGKELLSRYFNEKMDQKLKTAFAEKYDVRLPTVLENLYQKPYPNRYLASFTYFLSEHRQHFIVEDILNKTFIDFYQTHLLAYKESHDYPIHFVGSVAHAFRDVLIQINLQYRLESGHFVADPMPGLCRYHLQELNPPIVP